MLTSRLPLLIAFSCALLASALFAGNSALQTQARAQDSAPDAPPAQDVRPTVRDSRWLALVTQRGPQPGRLLTQSADVALTLNVNLSSGDVAGSAPSAAPVILRLIRGGATAWTVSATPFLLNGELIYAASFRGYDIGFTRPNSGDIFEAAAQGQTIALTLPQLSARVDASTDRVSGVAPGGQALTLVAFLKTSPGTILSDTITVNASGAYTAGISGADFKAGDSGYVLHRPNAQQSISSNFNALKLSIPAGRGEVRIIGAPNSTGSITVTNTRGVPVTVDVLTGALGEFAFSPESYNPAWSGKVATATLNIDGQTATVAAAPLTALYRDAEQRVTGTAQPGQRVSISQFSAVLPTPDFSTVLSTSAIIADASGVFSTTLPLDRDRSAAAVITSADGHETYFILGVPTLDINLGDDRPASASIPYYPQSSFAATLLTQNATVTITLLGPSGEPRSRYRARSYGSGAISGFSGQELPHFAAGDTLIVDDGFQPISATIPTFTGVYDAQSNRFGGDAPANARIEFLLSPPYEPNIGPDYPYSYNTGAFPVVPPWQPNPILPSPPIGAPPVPRPTPTPAPPVGGPPVPTLAPQPTPGPLSAEQTAPDTDTGRVPALGGIIPMPPARVSVTSTASGVYAIDLSDISGIRLPFIAIASLRDARGVGFTKQFLYGVQPCLGVRYVEVGGNSVATDQTCLPQPSSLQLISKNGALKSNFPVQSGSGPFSQFFDASVAPVRIEAGDRVRATGVASEDLIVPDLSLAYDHTAGRLQGRAPAGATLFFRVYQDGVVLNANTELSTTAGASGEFSITMTLPSNSSARAYYTNAQGVRFGATVMRPGLTFDTSRAQLSILLNLLEPFTVTATSSTTATGYITQTGNGYQLSSVDGSNQVVIAQPGDLITVTTPLRTLAMRVTNLSAAYDRAANTLTGAGPANARLTIRVQQNTLATSMYSTTVSPAGRYTFTLPALTESANMLVEYLDTAGNRTVATPIEPRSEISIGGACFLYLRGLPFFQRTISLYSASGALKSRVTASPFLVGTCFDALILPSDRIVVTEANTQVGEITVPAVDIRFDKASKTIRGRIPPNREFWLFGLDQQFATGVRNLRGFSDAAGNFTIDVSGSPLRGGPIVNFVFVDDQNNAFGLNVNVAQHQVFMPVVRR
jgi:hypothetical protein